MQCSPISYWPKASLSIANRPALTMGLRYRDLFEMLREHPGGKALQSRQKQCKLLSVACQIGLVTCSCATSVR